MFKYLKPFNRNNGYKSIRNECTASKGTIEKERSGRDNTAHADKGSEGIQRCSCKGNLTGYFAQVGTKLFCKNRQCAEGNQSTRKEIQEVSFFQFSLLLFLTIILVGSFILEVKGYKHIECTNPMVSIDDCIQTFNTKESDR